VATEDAALAIKGIRDGSSDVVGWRAAQEPADPGMSDTLLRDERGVPGEAMPRAAATRAVRPVVLESADLTLLGIVTQLLRDRRRILFWMALGGIAAVAVALLTKPTYSANASFTPQNSDATRSGLSSLAGQLGLSVPGSAASQSQFYTEVLRSHTLLAPLATDTVTVPELGGGPRTFISLFDAQGSPERMTEMFIDAASRASEARVSLQTGTVSIRVTTPWRSVSLALANRMLRRVNEFNVRTRQSQAAEERRFVEERLAVARRDQRAAEDRLEAFLRGNRQMMSPELAFAHDRLQREVSLQQALVTTLAQSYEDARLREVRDTPVITVVESPTASVLPDPRHRVLKVAVGLLLGALIGIVISLTKDATARRTAMGDAETGEFLRELRAARSGLGRLFRRAGGGRAASERET
jgi:uncharacterized protein involved in exopolysaccharide biosynthesis